MTADMRSLIRIVEGASIPPVVYHGSKREFDTFDMTKAEDGAHFFTTDRDHAAFFGPPKAYHISISNPLVITQDDLEDCMSEDDAADGVLPRDFVRDFVIKAKAEGHDGLIIKDFADLDYSGDVFLPFHPEQIKRVMGE